MNSLGTLTAADGEDDRADAVLIDLDTVMLGMHQGRRGVELNLMADMPASLDRLHEVAQRIVVLVEPPPRDAMEAHGRETPARLQTLHSSLGSLADELDIIVCPHGEATRATARNPAAAWSRRRSARPAFAARNSWYIGGDQEGIQAARTVGLRTVRIGPLGGDHLELGPPARLRGARSARRGQHDHARRARAGSPT